MHYTANAAFSKLASYEHSRGETCQNPVIPMLADSWQYQDGKTLDVKLRPGVKFHNKPPVNGRELTANDVTWNFTRLQKVARSGQIKPALALLDRVETTGPLSVRFHFTQPFAFAVPSLLAAMTGPFIYAQEAGGPKEDFRDPYKAWIGTGPFVFEDWRPGVKVVFTRNPEYFKPGQPYLDGLEVLVIEDDSTRTAALLSGKLDWVWRASPSAVEFVRRTRPEIVVVGCPEYAGFGAIWIRTDKAPWNDVRVRRALSMAVDRQTLIDTLFLGEGEILSTVPSVYGDFSLRPTDIPPGIRQYMEYRPDEAKKLLAEAGFPSGLSTTLEATRAFGSPYNEALEAMQAMWRKTGIEVEIKWYERGRFSETALVGNYNELAWSRAGEIGDPLKLFAFSSTSAPASNRSHIKDPDLDKLIAKYVATFEAKEQAALARQIQQRLVEQAYAIVQPTPLEYALLQPYVRNFGLMSHMSRASTLYERVWFDR